MTKLYIYTCYSKFLVHIPKLILLCSFSHYLYSKRFMVIKNYAAMGKYLFSKHSYKFVNCLFCHFLLGVHIRHGIVLYGDP